MARQPFAPIRKRNPGGMVRVSNDAFTHAPKLTSLVGQCLMAWSPAEAEMALMLGYLLGADNAAALAVFHSLRRSSSQREAVWEAGKVKLSATDKELLEATLIVHKSIEADRTALAHGHFGYYSKLPHNLLWMNTATYVAAKAHLDLAKKEYDKGDWDKVYAETYVYGEADLEQVLDGIVELATLWHRLRDYFRMPIGPKRDAAYRQQCNQSRTAEALATLRRKNNPSAPFPSPQPEPNR
jgi:hypothetical protein